MAEIRDYSVTADDNNAASPNGMANGCAPSTVNDTWREGIARMKRWYEDCQGAKTTTGSSNAYLLAASRVVASYAAGDAYMFKANHTNTSAGSTLNVDSVGAKAIVTPTGATIAAGSITSGGVYLVAYEASADKFMLIGGSHSGGDNPFIYNSSPTLTLENSTSEDTSGGRESQVVFKGLQSGSEESTLVKITASHEGTSDDQKGQLVIGVNDGNDNDAPTTAVTVASTKNVTFAGNVESPELNLKNPTSEDTSGGRESQVVFKGLQSGSEESTLVKIQASHEGTSDDEKGQLIVGVNDGNDGASPTTAVTIASTGTVTFAKQPVFPDASPKESRNFIDNGNMEVAQRVSGSGSVSFAAGDYKVGAIDRWWAWSGSAVAFDIKTATTAPTGFGNSLHIDITTPDASLAPTDAFYLNQQIEGLNVQSISKGTAGAKKVTVSFWVRSPETGVHIVELIDRTNSRQCSQSYTIASADTFEYHSVTFPADTTGSLSNTAVRALSLLFWLAAGSNYTSGSALGTTWHTDTNTRAKGQVNVGEDGANNFYITGVQMETGDTATPFVSESFQENLAKCQRYFERFNTYWYQRAGNSYATNVSVGHNFDFKVEKRATVTPTIPNGLGSSSGNIGVTTNTGNYASTQPSSFSHVSTSSMSVIYFGTGSGVAGLTSGSITMLFTNGSTVVDFDAEMS